MQGDIVGLLDSTGALVVEYKYDAWGKPISITGSLADTLGKRNPFRYRGYVYDEETGLYYLRSRYYNPEVGRFVNADALLGNVGGLGSHNVYAYCANMPVIAADPNGRMAAIAIGAFLKAVAAAAATVSKIAFWAGVCYGTGKAVGRAVGRVVASPRASSVNVAANAIADGRHYPASSASIDKYKSAMEGATYYLAGAFGKKVYIETTAPLTFEQALIMLGVTSCANLSEYYSKDTLTIGENGFDPSIQSYIGQTDTYGEKGMHVWGIYTKDSLAAEGLAFLFGSTTPNEITSGVTGYYHFHDPAHIIHIWFGLEY